MATTPTTSRFTEEQLQVINSPIDSHAKVIAVAGAGKTSTLLARIKTLMKSGVPASRIGVFMFNKSAQEEFSLRLNKAFDHQVNLEKPFIMTFHGYGLRLTKTLESRGLIEQAQLLVDEFSLIKLLRESAQQLSRTGQFETQLDEKDWMEDALLFIEQVKASTSSAVNVFQEGDWSSEQKFFPNLYAQFEQLRKAKKLRFFSDLIKDPLEFFLEARLKNNAIEQELSYLAPQYSHILIDEFQDISESQYQLLKCLYFHTSYWMIVGDVEQCIYEWRGANPDIMAKRVDTDFQKLTAYQLSQSFRFGHQIGMMATNVLAYNHSDIIVRGQNITTDCAFASSDKIGKSLLTELKHWKETNASFNNAAVLVRLYSEMVPLQLALMHRRIPYQLHGDSPLLENRQIRMLMTYVAVMAGALDKPELFHDKQDIVYLVTVPSLGISPGQKKALNQQAIKAPHLIPQLLEKTSAELSGWQAKKMLERADWLRSLTIYSKEPDKGINETIKQLGIYRYLENTSSKDIQFSEKVATCESFISYVAGVKLSAQALLSELKELDGNKQNNDASDGLHLMSLHKAKGLEFDLVILAGLKEGRFPYYDSGTTSSKLIESERRLFYVGITRAKKRLVILEKLSEQDHQKLNNGTVPISNKKNNNNEQALSRFIFEAQPLLCNRVISSSDHSMKVEGGEKEVESGARINQYIERAHLKTEKLIIKKEAEKQSLAPGEKVKHDQYGSGIVIRQEKTGNRMIFVEFEEVGFKRFNPKHTRLIKQ